MAGKRKAEDEPDVSDSDDDEIMSDEVFEAMKAESRARTDKEYSELFARLGLRQDAGLRYSDDSSSSDDDDDDDDDDSDEDDE
jgi:hypothetical protein